MIWSTARRGLVPITGSDKPGRRLGVCTIRRDSRSLVPPRSGDVSPAGFLRRWAGHRVPVTIAGSPPSIPVGGERLVLLIWSSNTRPRPGPPEPANPSNHTGARTRHRAAVMGQRPILGGGAATLFCGNQAVPAHPGFHR